MAWTCTTNAEATSLTTALTWHLLVRAKLVAPKQLGTEQLRKKDRTQVKGGGSKEELVRGIGTVGENVWRPYAQRSAKRRGKGKVIPILMSVSSVFTLTLQKRERESKSWKRQLFALDQRHLISISEHGGSYYVP